MVSNTNSIIHLPETEKSFTAKFSSVLNEEKLEGFYNKINSSHYNILRNANPKITFTNLCIDLMKNLQ